MINSLFIKNFRLLRHLEISRLGRVNLFVGKNNSGKSCLLEALQVYASKGNLDVLLELVASHDGNWESEIGPEAQVVLEKSGSPLKALFCGFRLPRPGDEGIEVGEIGDPTGGVALETSAYQMVQEDQITKRVPVSSGSLFDSELANLEFWLVVREGSRSTRLAPLENLDLRRLAKRRAFVGRSEPEFKYPFQSVPALNLTDRQVANLWDKVHLTDLESEIVAGLQIIQPKIHGVAFLGEAGARRMPSGEVVSSRRVPVVRLSDSAERYPLKSMGDGPTRVLQLVLSLVNAKDGLLLVDEFENGLHWTVQPHLWELIFRLSERLNVQVFATTHSQDCVRAFHSVWKGHEEAGSFHRLDRGGRNGVTVTGYDLETLSDAVDAEVEVR